MSAERTPLWRPVVLLAVPWVPLLYVWMFGLRWTLIGLGGVYGVCLVIVVAFTLGQESQRPRVPKRPRGGIGLG